MSDIISTSPLALEQAISHLEYLIDELRTGKIKLGSLNMEHETIVEKVGDNIVHRMTNKSISTLIYYDE